MKARLTGILESLDAQTGVLLLAVGDVAYEVLAPGYAVGDLSQQLHRSVTLHCLEYLEGNAMGGNLVPRLIGFLRARDKVFFQRFTSVKGIGSRKALRALARPPGELAGWIESGDDKMLATLPEVGKRTAQQIIAALKGKMGDFALEAAEAGGGRRALTGMEREALEILLQLGERRDEAEELIARARDKFREAASTDALVQAAYRLKTGAVAP